MIETALTIVAGVVLLYLGLVVLSWLIMAAGAITTPIIAPFARWHDRRAHQRELDLLQCELDALPLPGPADDAGLDEIVGK